VLSLRHPLPQHGPFYGKPPTGEQGTMSETHAVRLRGGRIVEQLVGDNNFSMPHQELVTLGDGLPARHAGPESGARGGVSLLMILE
jgi:hypothetical protein